MLPEERRDIGAGGLYTALREAVAAAAATVQGGVHVLDGERPPVGADKRVDIAGSVVPGESGRQSAALPIRLRKQKPEATRNICRQNRRQKLLKSGQVCTYTTSRMAMPLTMSTEASLPPPVRSSSVFSGTELTTGCAATSSAPGAECTGPRWFSASDTKPRRRPAAGRPLP